MEPDGSESVHELHFFYDAQSRPVVVEYNGEKYRYVHNLQGDVVGIVDHQGDVVTEYKYDAWGKVIDCVSTGNIGRLNLFRYRGYTYDEEIDLYYLRSRYYNQVLNRFINSDTQLRRTQNIPAHNIYAYCVGNPVSNVDLFGNTEVYFNVYLKPGNFLDIGHADISIGDTTYTYGQYDTEATWGPVGMMGDGVLEVGSRQQFIDEQIAKGRAVTSFQIDMTEDEVASLQEYFDDMISTGTFWKPKDAKRSREVKRFKFKKGPLAVYNLLSNNCTTVALGALRKSCKAFPSSIYGFSPSSVKRKFIENFSLKSIFKKIVNRIIEIGY